MAEGSHQRDLSIGKRSRIAFALPPLMRAGRRRYPVFSCLCFWQGGLAGIALHIHWNLHNAVRKGLVYREDLQITNPQKLAHDLQKEGISPSDPLWETSDWRY